jgi:molecular chaperone GrpE
MTKHGKRAEDEILGSTETIDEQVAVATDVPQAEDDTELARDMRAESDFELDVEVLTAKAAERDELFGIAQRTQADFENYRKRMARELEGAQARGVARLAITGASEAAVVDEQLIEGLRLVQRELLAALGRAGVERYCEVGEQFDPAVHEAVSHQEVDGAAAGAIVEVYQPGYKLGNAVIRAARVMVAA